MSVSGGTFYVRDVQGHDVDVSLMEGGQVSICVLGDSGVANLDDRGVQALIDVLTFMRHTADKYGES
ncbi:hypothetical protein [Streptomyces sp. NPDC002346]